MNPTDKYEQIKDIKRLNPVEQEAMVLKHEQEIKDIAKHLKKEKKECSFMSYQEGFEAGNKLAIEGIIKQLRQLHDSYSCASDSLKLRARGKKCATEIVTKDFEPIRVRIMREAYELADRNDSEGYNAIKVMCGDVQEMLPPQREWVGLTDDEKQAAYIIVDGWSNCVNFIEKTLREKNNG